MFEDLHDLQPFVHQPELSHAISALHIVHMPENHMHRHIWRWILILKKIQALSPLSISRFMRSRLIYM
jgi:hypothetical protein